MAAARARRAQSRCFQCGTSMETWCVIRSTMGEDGRQCPDCGLPVLCAVTAGVERPEYSGIRPGVRVSQSSSMCPIHSLWDVAGDEKPRRTAARPYTWEDANRLRSLDRRPNQTLGCPVTDLANDGFSSTGFGDEVQWCECGGSLRTWRPGDQLTSEHWRIFPADISASCEQRVGSVPHSGPDTVDGQLLSQLQRMGLEEMPVDEAINPAMGTEEARLSTFQNWPNLAAVEPRLLAKAGFVYTGHRDNVKCFCCDGGLRNWEMGDDPWMEHAKWFPRCDYLLQVRGSEYVCSVQQLHADILQSLFQGRWQIQSRRPPTQGAEEQERERREETRGVVQSPTESARAGAERRQTAPTQRDLSAEEQLRRLKEERTCKVCMDKEVSIVFIPCGHLVVCRDCAPNLSRCPICRALIRGSVRAFMS